MMPPLPLAIVHLESVEHPWLWAALIALGMCVLFRTYRGIFQRSERRLAWALMTLRAVGLLALLLALAKPTWTRQSKEVDPARLAVVLDNSLSMSLPYSNGHSRYSLALEAVRKLKAGWGADGMGTRGIVDLFDINGASLKLDKMPEQPTVERTDLGRAVTDSVNRLRSKPPAGVVVISDGMDNTGRQDFSDLAAISAPIFGVGFRQDSNAAGLDLALKQVRAPERVLVNNQIKAEVVLAKTGGPATDATVNVKLGTETYASQKVSFGGGNAEQTVAVTFTPTKPGHFVFTAAVEAEAGERFLGNNSKHFPLEVDKERIRVLYLEGFLRYEYKFLKSRLQEDPDIRLVPVVRAVRPEKSDMNPGKELLTAEGLKNLDVVILGDLEGSYMSDAEYRALTRWLEEKGHALLVLGGYRSFGPDGFRSTPLADVVPVVFADKPPYQSEEPFVAQLTDAGRRHPVFELTGDHEKDAAAWSASPPLQGASMVLRAKPVAEVLAVNPNVLIEGKPAVVAATQRYGAGHSMVLTADTTWHWSRLPRVLGQADTLYARFWSQTVRWLAGRGRDEERPVLAVSSDRPDYDLGKRVAIRVVRQPRPSQDLSAAEVGAEVTGPSKRPQRLALIANSAEPDVLTAEFYPSAGGRYELAATLMKEGQAIANQRSEFLVHGSDLELADTRTNPETLRSLASVTGGSYADIDEIEKLVERVPRKERYYERVERMELWNSPVLFLAFLTAVTAEWLLRRRNHLV
jgi:uncharacterized membrane protein